MNKLDYYIEIKQKEKIALRVIELKKLNYSYEIIENELVSKKFPTKLVHKVMKEQGIFKKPINTESGVKKENIKKVSKVIETNPIVEIKESKEKIKPKLSSPKFHFDFRENKRMVIAIGMLFLFFIALGIFSHFNKIESGNGTCPLVKVDDVKKINSLYVEKNNELSFIEYDQMVGAYFGKSDCNLINDQTVIRLRSIDLS